MISGVPGDQSAPRLLGRREETIALDRVVEEVRAGRSSVVVVRGEPGVGKSVLLDYLVDRASGCRVSRAGGVESEMELPLAGLQQLVGAWMLERIDRIRPGSAWAAVSPNPPANSVAVKPRGSSRSASGLPRVSATIRSRTCSSRPPGIPDASSARIVVAQPFDQELRQAAELLDVGRLANREHHRDRLGLEATRDERQDLGGFAVESLHVVDHAHERPLLGRVGQQAERSQAEQEAVRSRPIGQPERQSLEQSYLRRLEALPDETRMLLLVAAAEPVGDPLLVWRAAESLGRRRRGWRLRGGCRAALDRRGSRIPPSARALGGLQSRAGRGPPVGPLGAGRRDRPGGRPGPAGVASRDSGPRA